ncbi:helix-turn-helix domain-containing protein [Agromyces albus]|uniref:XRE family transcriptional regulator n=1 Tax=Agromyces albus TaxID=205332 RepID=A0A4V1QX38_9MICO|nr:XRE family transcriptional regulator [Agromyces albus]RXZ68306.1 XRE family transcriptional regulator [Agromyces albus]
MASGTSYGTELRARRIAAKLTQRELAERADVPQPNVSAYEVGRRMPNRDTIERLDRVLQTPHLARVRDARDSLIEAAARRGLSNLRVFGSVARGDADDRSDVDLLVHPGPEASLFDLAGFMIDAEAMLGTSVDVVSDRGHSPVLERIISEAVPL